MQLGLGSNNARSGRNTESATGASETTPWWWRQWQPAGTRQGVRTCARIYVLPSFLSLASLFVSAEGRARHPFAPPPSTTLIRSYNLSSAVRHQELELRPIDSEGRPCSSPSTPRSVSPTNRQVDRPLAGRVDVVYMAGNYTWATTTYLDHVSKY